MVSQEQLTKLLEEKSIEIKNLKKNLQACENERNQLQSQKKIFDSKQSPDVQNLLSQKRELQTQLEREESEKHELFLQINQLIAEIAQLRVNDKEKILENQLNELNEENNQLKIDFSRKELAFQKLTEELNNLRGDFERSEKLFQLEKARLTDEVLDCQKEIKLKTAALDSYKLANHQNTNAKTEHRLLYEEINKKDELLRLITDTNEELEHSLEEADDEIERLREEIKSMKLLEDSKKNDLEKLNELFEKKENETAQALNSVKNLKLELEKAENQILKLKKLECNQLNTNNDQNNRENENKVMQLVNALDQSKNDLKEKDLQILEFQKNFDIKINEIDKLTNALKLAQTTVIFCEKCKTFESEIMNLKNNENNIKNELFKTNETNNLLELSIKNLTKEKQDLIQDALLKTESLTIKEELIINLKEKVQSLEKELDETLSKLNLRNLKLQSEIEVLRQNLYTQTIKSEKTLKQLNEKQSILEENEKKELLASICDSLELNINTECFNDFHSILKTICDELENLKYEKFKLKNDLQDLEDIKVSEKQLKASNSELQKTIQEVESNLNYLKNKDIETNAQLNNLKAEKLVLTEQIQKLKENLMSQEIQIKTLNSNQNQEKDNKDKELNLNLTNKVKELMEENANLAGELLKFESNIDERCRQALNDEKTKWLEEKANLQTEIKILNEKLKELSLTKSKSEISEPIPKPRKSYISKDFLNDEKELKNVDELANEVETLQKALEKQKRLVTVLRKKLQSNLLQEFNKST